MQTSCRGVVQDGTIVLREGSNALAEGTEVLVTPLEKKMGSPAAILAAMENSPKVPSEWVDELQELIAQGRRGPSRRIPFAEEKENLENS